MNSNWPFDQPEKPGDDLAICPCCGKQLPADELELTFRRPDIIAAMAVEEIERRCAFNDEYYVLDEERYFLRCTLPLPVHGSDQPYSIGAWAELSATDFRLVWNLWSDENQADTPPMSARLSNMVPFHDNTLGMSAAVQLTGPHTRPEITLQESGSSLYAEQSQGIARHRAHEYARLVAG